MLRTEGPLTPTPRTALLRLFLVLLFSVTALASLGCSLFPQGESEDLATVVRVIDGDTIEVQDPRRGRGRVRYIGIDTPEVSGSVECFGAEAKEKNRELVEGKRVRLERDTSDTDRFGRWLRYVYVSQTLVNGELVRGGYAAAVRYPPDVRRQEALEALEREAKAERRGLWGPACADNPNRRPRFR